MQIKFRFTGHTLIATAKASRRLKKTLSNLRTHKQLEFFLLNPKLKDSVKIKSVGNTIKRGWEQSAAMWYLQYKNATCVFDALMAQQDFEVLHMMRVEHQTFSSGDLINTEVQFNFLPTLLPQ